MEFVRRIVEHPVLEYEKGKKIRFFFEDREIEAFEGETIAAALEAAGVRWYRETAKYGRKRGIFCAIGKCSSCLVVADNRVVKACQTLVKEGMIVKRLRGKPQIA